MAITQQREWHKIFGLLTLLIAVWQCQEPYENPDLNASKDIPVVEGTINNTGGPHTVSLYYARPYNETNNKYITGAEVVITDGQGNEYNLNEGDNGRYSTHKGELTGIIGESYFVTIEMPNGDIVKSTPTIMPDTIPIDDVFRQNNTVREEVRRNYYGNPIVVSDIGIGVFVTLKSNMNDNAFYRLSSSMIVHAQDTQSFSNSIIWDHPETGEQIEADSTSDEIYSCYSFYNSFGLPRIGELFSNVTYSEDYLTHFMFLIYDDEEYYTDRELIQWIVAARVHSLTADQYNYYDAQLVQLNAQDRIFDPIPDQITGNLYLEDDPESVVLGIFEVSSITKRNYSIYIVESMGIRWQQQRILPDTINVTQGCYLEYTITNIIPAEEE